jgi:hypothetical protein
MLNAEAGKAYQPVEKVILTEIGVYKFKWIFTVEVSKTDFFNG